ncbi:MAG: ABC transporter permease [Erysipelotrichaceae bacterium]|nr:ABC transporter permease [Erysipelotrichaceae bacterium]
MGISWNYFSAIVSSTFRMCTPILLAALAGAICSKASVFNIAMEGCMMISTFFSIAVNYATHGNVLLSVLAGVLSSVVVSAILGFFIIKLKASPVVAGMAINTMSTGITEYLLYAFFKTKGIFSDSSMVGLTKIEPFFAKWAPEAAKLLSGLTFIDYLAWVLAIVIYIFLYKTVIGYRLRAIGINAEAAKSLGTPVEKYQFITISLSGILCGLAGVVLSMGSVTLYIQNMAAGRGYIAMTANNLGQSHPLGVLAASVFFGCCQALGNFLQRTAIKTQITAAIPYVATILAMVFGSLRKKVVREMKIRKSLKESGES